MRTRSCRLAPPNCPEFKRLCKLLQRNDAATTVVETWRARTPFGYGERLGTALQNNTVVFELFLQLAFLLSERDMDNGSTDSASCLLQYLKHSPTLRSVRFAYRKCNNLCEDLSPVGTMLLELMMNAAFQNPTIRLVDLEFPDLPLPTLIQSLSAAQPRLTAFRLHSCRGANLNAAAIETAAAQIFGMLPMLEDLTLKVEPVAPFLSPLTRCMALRHLTVAPCYQNEDISATDTAALCGILSWRESVLEHISLEGVICTSMQWTDIAQALKSNTQLHMLTLRGCDFQKVPVFASPDPLALGHRLDNVRTLELFDCRWFAESQWQQGECFPDLSGYLPFTVFLCCLTLKVKATFETSSLHVPDDFLIALRANGSLQDVTVSATCPVRLPLPKVVRYMQAITERNRLLPQILSKAVIRGNSTGNKDVSANLASSRVLFPTLFCVARQVPRMAPNALFRGLLSISVEGIGPIARHCKRRIE
jgi:hypothetical protein